MQHEHDHPGQIHHLTLRVRLAALLRCIRDKLILPMAQPSKYDLGVGGFRKYGLMHPREAGAKFSRWWPWIALVSTACFGLPIWIAKTISPWAGLLGCAVVVPAWMYAQPFRIHASLTSVPFWSEEHSAISRLATFVSLILAMLFIFGTLGTAVLCVVMILSQACFTRGRFWDRRFSFAHGPIVAPGSSGITQRRATGL